MQVTKLSCILSLQICFLLFINVRLSSAASCSFSSCKISLTGDGPTKTIDLNSYKELLTYNDQANNRYYDFQPCDTISGNDPDNCIGFKGCQRESATSSHPMGKKDNPVYMFLRDNKSTVDVMVCVRKKRQCTYTAGSDPFIHFNGAEDGGYKRGIQATYKCDETQAGLTLTLTGAVPVASDETTYQFTLAGKDACAKSGGGGGGGGGSSGLDGASVFLIIFFVVIAVYLIAGIIYKGAVKGARGTEIIPNVEFWKQVPGLIRDGALFIYRALASKLCNKEYNQV